MEKHVRKFSEHLRLGRASGQSDSTDLQSAQVARGAFLLMAQLADAREESLRRCSPQRVSVIFLQQSEPDRCCR